MVMVEHQLNPGSFPSDLFHPAVEGWLKQTYPGPTPAQAEAWPRIRRGEHVLVAAPTGSGKTLCAFLSAVDQLVVQGQAGPLPDETRVLYVSPLKALSNDIERNLQEPLQGIRRELTNRGYEATEITTAVRTGDTSASDRARHTKRPPHIYVTTPESLYILLTSDGGRGMLSTVETVIVDEVHALIRDKRGAHLALSLERLDDLLRQHERRPAVRIGLSATQKPIARVAEFLMGHKARGDTQPGTPCAIVNHGHQRAIDLGLCLPDSPLESVMSAEAWTEIYDQLAKLIDTHRTVLVFTNTRRLAERITRFLAERLGESAVTSHHGSLSRQRRHAAERALKDGRLKALVATASLELGIDVGDVDLVCQIGSPGSIATLLQRVGRSGHFVGGLPKGRVFPLSRDDLVECCALLDAANRGELDEVKAPEAPLDILAQQIVAWVASSEKGERDLYDLVRQATPFANLSFEKYLAVIRMLAEGYATSRGRRGAYLHHDRVGRRIKARRGARLTAITNGGAIPENFDYEVLLEPTDLRVGTVHEDFAIESSPGDIFQLGNTSYQIVKVDPGAVRVQSAHGLPPTIPFWLGEAPSRTDELSFAVSRLRERIAEVDESEVPAFTESLRQELRLDASAAKQLVDYLRTSLRALGHMPSQSMLVIERFFDETEGMHVVIHSPFGSRFNRGFGLALRKRFCRSFNVELQAAAGEDALVLSLGPMHSFPLESVFRFLHSKTVRDVLVQALLDAPLFQTRWRWNASRALGILRFRGGKKVPPRFQRMQSDDLLALCFPDQVACLENIPGDRSVPEHPLVEQTIVDSLTEAMDVDRLERVLIDIEEGRVRCVARDATEPSPLAHEILNARPYAFLDDAPLEERRTQAVQMRRFLDPSSANDIGALDPRAILQVISEARPEPRDADELHDALLVHLAFNEEDIAPYAELFAALESEGRAFRCRSGRSLYVATERAPLFVALVGATPPATYADLLGESPPPTREDALVEVVRGRLEMVGPTTELELSEALGLPAREIADALLTLEGEGFVIRGRFRPGPLSLPESGELDEFCERRLLARIHRLTLNQLRREIEPVSPATFIDFLTYHQGVQADSRHEGAMGTLAVLEQLSGYPCAAEAWESQILPVRVRLYQKGQLDELCLSGQVSWNARLASGKATALRRGTPIRILPRADRDLWSEGEVAWDETKDALAADARRVAELLQDRGALFFEDIRRSSGLLPSRAENAVAELIGAGLVTTDSFSGVRSLIDKDLKKARERVAARGGRGRRAPLPLQAAGRISWLERPESLESLEGAALALESDEEERLLEIAWQLLRRWGVVFRKVLEREPHAPSWGKLLPLYHRLEARGEIRGGRFVTRFSGEQFATKEAISELRKVRRNGPSEALLRISACDPLNLVGILTPGQRLPAKTSNQLLLRGGTTLAVKEGSRTTLLPLPDDIDAEGGREGPSKPGLRGLTLHEAENIFRSRPSSEWERLTAE